MNFISTLIFFTLCLPLAKCNTECTTWGWFGPDCKYQCHCENNICNYTSGRCQRNVKCAKGWFGSNCQYRDLATILNSNVTSNPGQQTDWLFDRNDLSCYNQYNLQFIKVAWNESFRFNWLSIIFNKGYYKETLASLSRIKLTFKTSSSNKNPCVDKQTSFVDNNTMIVKCNLTEDIQEIYMTGDGVKAMCSLYISGGRNVALKQPTNQTSTYKESYSERAVDGNTSGFWDKNRCTHSNGNRTTPSWTLTFDTPMIINRFLIYNRVDTCCKNRLQRFRLTTFDDKSGYIQEFTNDMSIKDVYVVPVQHDKTNTQIKSVKISSANSSTILTLCEVEAYGDCPPGKWGLDCKGFCPTHCVDTCNKETGSCHFCYGYRDPPYCTEDCYPGTYGLNCSGSCPINCNDSVCDAFTGYCISCLPGFKGQTCNEKCQSGQWGINCSKRCEDKCVDNMCNNENGDCKTGCFGYRDFPQCSQVCNSGNYGKNCIQTCPENCYKRQCNRVNGSCDSCQPGYRGYQCNKVCLTGRYGINCTQRCPERCSTRKCNHVTGTCDSCVSGYQGNLCDKVCYSGSYGINCTQQCPENCHNRECYHDSGSCYSCEPGYHGNKCKEACDSGSWGYECKERCSANCLKKTCNGHNGHCNGGCQTGYELPSCTQDCRKYRHGVNCSLECSARCRDNLCSAKEGFCFSCYPGYQGQHCDQNCNATYYGQDCANKCNTSCIDQMCDPRNGSCSNCSQGRHGDQCDICPTGRFGERCYNTCSAHCLVETCHPENGTCHGGCKDGYEGDTCILVAAGTSSSIVRGAVGAVIANLVIVLFIVAGVILWRRRDGLFIKKNQKARRAETDNLGLSASQGSSRDRPISDVIYNNLQPVLQDTSIAIKDLNVFMISHTMEYFEDQFNSIPLPQNVTMEVAQSMENISKNRYKNICTYDHSRVRLMINREKNERDYINASYIKGPDNKERFIASQGPTQIMMNDFVRMIWEHKVDTVVMLTNLIEERKVKCVKYWPDAGEVQFGEISVKLTDTKSFADYIIRSFEMFKGDKEVTRSFTQFHFTSWPDKSVPVTPWSLVEFLKRVSAQPTTSPMVVHCSAGVGRTGTFIALHNVIKQAQDTGRVDFYRTLAKMRQDRILMIQIAEQYLFLHKAAQAAIVCIETSVTSKDISDRMHKLQEKSIIGKTQLEEEFKGVCTLCESFNDTKDTIQELDNDGNVYENSANVNPTLKNRYASIIPKQRFRPYLSCESKDMGEYINAVFVPGFNQKDQQLLTQLPMPTTVLDFWRLVSQYDVSLIVAFEIDAMAKDESFGNYLPIAEDEKMSCPPFEIISVVMKQEHLWEERRLKIDTAKPKLSQPTSVAGSHSVIHIKCLFTDLSPKNLLSLVKQIRSYDAHARGRTLYTCRNGAHYSGLICVLSLLLDRIEQDGTVCVPLVVGQIKSIRLEVIPTQEQYRVIYDVLVRYFQTSKHYENVGNGVSTKNMEVNKTTVNEPVDHDSNVYANT